MGCDGSSIMPWALEPRDRPGRRCRTGVQQTRRWCRRRHDVCCEWTPASTFYFWCVDLWDRPTAWSVRNRRRRWYLHKTSAPGQRCWSRRRHDTCLMAIFHNRLGNPVPECHHSGFYWSKGNGGVVTTGAIHCSSSTLIEIDKLLLQHQR